MSLNNIEQYNCFRKWYRNSKYEWNLIVYHLMKKGSNFNYIVDDNKICPHNTYFWSLYILGFFYCYNIERKKQQQQQLVIYSQPVLRGHDLWDKEKVAL
jgi:hypothetical protein